MWLIGSTVAWAEAPEAVSAGEMWGYWSGWTGNAYTVPKSMVVLHPWIRSGIGVTDQWDIKASVIGEILGPQLSTEVAFVENDQVAVSLEARAKAAWAFNALDYGFVPHFSAHLGPGTLFDASFGIQAQAGTSKVPTSAGDVILQRPGLKALRPELGLEFKANDALWFVLTARSDLEGWQKNGAHGVLGAYLIYGKGAFGFDFGLNLAVLGLQGLGEDVASIERTSGVDLWNPPAAIPLPLPVFNFWFRL